MARIEFMKLKRKGVEIMICTLNLDTVCNTFVLVCT